MYRSIRKLISSNFGKTAYKWTSARIGGSTTVEPEKIGSFKSNVKNLSLSDSHGALITTDGNLHTWGKNTHGQLGYLKEGKKAPTEETPHLVDYFQKHKIKVKQVVCGKQHTLALDEKGRVFSWGRGTYKRNAFTKFFYPAVLALGHEKSQNLSTPKPIKALKNEEIVQISTGNDFAMALSKSNKLYVWGRGEFGVLGFSNKQQPIPIVNPFVKSLAADEDLKILKIDSCSDFSSILLSNGKVFSFGNNDNGNLGIGNSQSVDSCDAITHPMGLSFLEGEEFKVKDISCAESMTAYLSEEGKVYYSGLKIYYNPKLFELDYDKFKVKSFCATDSGVGVVTECNRMFYQGNFWRSSSKSLNFETGIKEVDMGDKFGNGVLGDIGGKYCLKYSLVQE